MAFSSRKSSISDSGEKMAAMVLSAEAAVLFKEGISLMLSRWTALQMAVQNEWGGRDSHIKAQQLAIDIFSWFSSKKEPHYIDDLEELLDEAMISLNTVTEDGSIEEVAEKLMIMHEECLEGNYSSIEKLRHANNQGQAVPYTEQVVNGDDDDNDNDDNDDENDDDETMQTDGLSDMMVDGLEFMPNSNPTNMRVGEPRSTKMTESEDGWKVVAPRRNRGRKNRC